MSVVKEIKQIVAYWRALSMSQRTASWLVAAWLYVCIAFLTGANYYQHWCVGITCSAESVVLAGPFWPLYSMGRLALAVTA